MKKMKNNSRGFLFAPLLGTTLLLVSVLFISHVARTETNIGKEVTADAYHNRLVSLLEEVRSDYASLFKLGFTRSIDQYMFKLSTGGSTIDMQKDQTRETYCNSELTFLQQQICSTSSGGIKQWAAEIVENLSFEGTQFYSKYDQASLDQITSSQFCPNYVNTNTFDCKAFKTRNLACIPGSNLYGTQDCSDGSFFVSFDVEKIYDKMPRVCAKDSLGNEICSGGLSDKNFAVHPKTRLFKYLDLAAAFRDSLAYGPSYNAATVAANLIDAKCPANDAEHGVADGLCCESTPGKCLAPSGCSQETKCNTLPSQAGQKPDAQVKTSFIDLFKNSCPQLDKYKQADKIEAFVSHSNIYTKTNLQAGQATGDPGAPAGPGASYNCANAANDENGKLKFVLNVPALDDPSIVARDRDQNQKVIDSYIKRVAGIDPLLVIRDNSPAYKITNNLLTIQITTRVPTP